MEIVMRRYEAGTGQGRGFVRHLRGVPGLDQTMQAEAHTSLDELAAPGVVIHAAVIRVDEQMVPAAWSCWKPSTHGVKGIANYVRPGSRVEDIGADLYEMAFWHRAEEINTMHAETYIFGGRVLDLHLNDGWSEVGTGKTGDKTWHHLVRTPQLR